MNEEKKDIQNPITAAEPLPADHAIADEDGTIVPPDTQVKAHNAASSTPKNTANSRMRHGVTSATVFST